MSYIQVATPNPNIPCKPGWCLQYVREAFGLPAKYASATEAWEKSTSQHRDRNFPAGVWLPVWYGLVNEPLGHVVLRAPDGSVYSTSDLTNTPHHHADLADLEAFYAYYGMTLTYRGWTEDVASYPVIANASITPQSTETTPAPIPEGFLMALTDDQQQLMYDRLKKYVDSPISAVPDKTWEVTVIHGGTHSVKTELVLARKEAAALRSVIGVLAKNPNLTADQITEAVKAGLAESVVTVDVNVNGAV